MPGSKKIEVVFRVGDREERILYARWKPDLGVELEKYHGIDGHAELVDLIAEQLILTFREVDKKTVKDALMRLTGHIPKPVKVVTDENTR